MSFSGESTTPRPSNRRASWAARSRSYARLLLVPFALFVFSAPACFTNGKSGRSTKTSRVTVPIESLPTFTILPADGQIPMNARDSSGNLRELTFTAEGLEGEVTWEVLEGPATIDYQTGKLRPLADRTGLVVVQARSVQQAGVLAQTTLTIYAPLDVSVSHRALSYNLPSVDGRPAQMTNFSFLQVGGGHENPLVEIIDGPGTLTTEPGSAGRKFRFTAPNEPTPEAPSGAPQETRVRVRARITNSFEPAQEFEEQVIVLRILPRISLYCLEGADPVVSLGGQLQFRVVDGTGAGAISYRISGGTGSIHSVNGLYSAPAQLPSPPIFEIAASDELGNHSKLQGTLIEGMTISPTMFASKPSPQSGTPYSQVFDVEGGAPAADGSYTLTVTDAIAGTGEKTLTQYNALGRGTFSTPTVIRNGNFTKYRFTYTVPKTLPQGASELRITVYAAEPATPAIRRNAQIIVSEGMVVLQTHVERLRFGEKADFDPVSRRARVFDVVGGMPPYSVYPCPPAADDVSAFIQVVPIGESRYRVQGPSLTLFRDAIQSGGKPWRDRTAWVCFDDQLSFNGTTRLAPPLKRRVTLEQGPLLISGTGEKKVTSVVVDKSTGSTKGHFYVSGWLKNGTLDGVTAGAKKVAFVMGFDADGRKKWTRAISDTSRTTATGNPLITAGDHVIPKLQMNGSDIYFVATTLSSDAIELGLIGRYSAAGTLSILREHVVTTFSPLRVNLLDDSDREINMATTTRSGLSFRFSSLHIDPTLSEIFVAGTIKSRFRVYLKNGTDLGSMDRTDAFLAAYDMNGAALKTISTGTNAGKQKSTFLRSGTTQNDEATDVFVQSSGVYVTGHTASRQFTSGSGNGSAAGGTDLFATLLNTQSLGISWAIQTGNAGVDLGGQILRGSHDGHVYFSGVIGATASPGDLPSGPSERDRSVVVKLDFNSTPKKLLFLLVAHKQLDPDWVGRVSVPAITYRAIGNQAEGPDDRAIPKLFIAGASKKPQTETGETRAFTYLNYYGVKTGVSEFSPACLDEGTAQCRAATQLPYRQAKPDADLTRGWSLNSSGVDLSSVSTTTTRPTVNPANGQTVTERERVIAAGTVDGRFYDDLSQSGTTGNGTDTDLVILEFEHMEMDPR